MREEHPPAVRGPDGRVAAAAEKVGHIKEFRDAAIAAAVRDFPKAGAIGADNVRVAMIVFAADRLATRPGGN